MCDTIVAHLIFTHLQKQTPQDVSELANPLYICIAIGLAVINAINSSENLRGNPLKILGKKTVTSTGIYICFLLLFCKISKLGNITGTITIFGNIYHYYN
jgi:hypothetical protein